MSDGALTAEIWEKTTMKLSEAIRLGSLIRPQAYDRFYDHEDDSSCALGAAMEAIGVDIKSHRANEMNAALMETPDWREWVVDFKGRKFACPECAEYVEIRDETGTYKNNVSSIIIHLNNEHMWMREQIADWVSIQEASVPAQPAQELAGHAV